MLVLTRRVGERIYIGDDIVIQIGKIDRYHVSIGIDAPKDISILREEVLLKNKLIERLELKAAQAMVDEAVGYDEEDI